MLFNIFPQNKNIKKTILNVVSIYLITTILLVVTLGFFYINSQKEQILHAQKQQMNSQANLTINQLKKLHNNSSSDIKYPRINNIKTAIYDIDKKVIFSQFDKKIHTFNKEYFFENDFVYFIYKVKPYYLGTAYLIIEKPREYKLINTLIKLSIFLILTIIVLVITSFFLAKILIKPLSDNIDLLDKFLKDTTHELNTPIAAILANIEMLNLENMDEKNQKKIHRIKIGATTISSIYDDLSFLILNNKIVSKDENINITNILYSRIEYFKILSDFKNITFVLDVDDDIFLNIDDLKLSRLFDNLISNAIKYSKVSSKINIILSQNYFIIEDEGSGISEENIKHIFERYKRFDTTVGGFGIGYNIIYSIIKEYNININIESKVDIGTKVTLTW